MENFNPWLRKIQRKHYINNNRISRQQPINVRGVWDSTFGKMILTQEGVSITGYYYRDDGLLSGVINEENVLDAVWKEGPTYQPPIGEGTATYVFSLTEFNGTWGYGDQPQYYSWIGRKSSNTFFGVNCYRYRIRHNSPEVPEVVVNDERISYGEETSYFYPDECSAFAEFQLFIMGEITSEKVPVEPGFSYTFLIQGNLPNITIDVIIDNPFPNLLE